MISQIPGGVEGLEQLVRDGKSLRGSDFENDGSFQRLLSQVTLYAQVHLYSPGHLRDP